MNVSAVAEQLRKRIGFDPQSLGSKVLSNAVAERMRTLAIADPAVYAAHLANSDDEFAVLVDEVLVPETWFFRGGQLFSFLAQHISQATASTSSRRFRILSAPCSSGEEPYSLVIALMEAGIPSNRWMVEGIDLSLRSLNLARSGLYREMAFRQTPAELKTKYFRKHDKGWELDSSLRGLVRFRQTNLFDPELLAGEAAYDLIFCRNVLIYLHEEARARVLDNLDRLLAPRGILCMGHAEPWALLEKRFQMTGPHSHFLFERAPAPGAIPLRPATKRSAASVVPRRSHKPTKTAARRLQREPEPQPVTTPVVGMDRLNQARKEADAGNLENALQSCLAQLSVSEPSADAYSLLGVIHQARKQRSQAMECFRKALYLEPQHEEALLHLLLLYQENGDEAAANLLRRRLDRTVGGGES